MKTILLMIGIISAISSQGAFLHLNSSQDFRNLVSSSNVPVVVQFSAYWCQPCQNLKAAFNQVAGSFSDSQVRLAVVDAYINSDLQQYLQGGYPTVRTFNGGSLTSKSFVGSKSSSYVRRFIRSLIHDVPQEFIEEWAVGGYCPIDSVPEPCSTVCERTPFGIQFNPHSPDCRQGTACFPSNEEMLKCKRSRI